MTDPSAPREGGRADAPQPDGDVLRVGSEPEHDEAGQPVGDTTVRRPRVPAPRDAVPLVEADGTSDTIIVRRGSRRRSAESDSHLEPAAGSPTPAAAALITAYPSRAAAPVRGSRAGSSAHVSPVPRPSAPVPDAHAIGRAIRGRARRRLVAVVFAIASLIIVLTAALFVLVFAVGV